MSQEENLAVMRQAMSAFNHPSRREEYFHLYSDSVVLSGYSGVGPGISNVKAFYSAFWSAFPDAQLAFEDLFASGDRVACRFQLSMTHKGDFNGIPATGKSVVLPGITILRFEHAKCVERWSQADFFGLLGQLGAIPTR